MKTPYPFIIRARHCGIGIPCVYVSVPSVDDRVEMMFLESEWEGFKTLFVGNKDATFEIQEVHENDDETGR